MTSKKDCAKRLGIYLLIAFTFSAMLIVFLKPMQSSETVSFIVAELFCASPAIASLITRAVTKEGFSNMKLHLNLTGNLRHYLLAFAIPVIGIFAMYLVPVMAAGHGSWLSGFTFKNVLACVMILVGQAAMLSVGLLGEELGWRGYMNQKMQPLFGTVGTCLLGGIIWGAWHFPIDIANYLAGSGTLRYSLETAFGRLALLTCFGVFLMWLTKKTGSVFPAVVAHGIYNASQSVVMMLLGQGDIPEDTSLPLWTDILRYIPMLIIAVIFMILLLKDKKKEDKTL
ncbi:MAG: CPBP family intramembrane metalloprotease [Ruminococcus sp.]|nr:CPBP family intramembrane metalloprotease [Ruminococcus sp.]